MESIALFFATWIITWPFLILLFLLAASFEHNKCYWWETLSLIGIGVVTYNIFDASLISAGIVLLSYAFIGIGWSYYRWKKHTAKFAERVLEESDAYMPSVVSELSYSKNISKIVFWIISWPASMLANLVGDLYDAISAFVRNYLGGLYKKSTLDALNTIADGTGAKPEDIAVVISNAMSSATVTAISVTYGELVIDVADSQWISRNLIKMKAIMSCDVTDKQVRIVCAYHKQVASILEEHFFPTKK